MGYRGLTEDGECHGFSLALRLGGVTRIEQRPPIALTVTAAAICLRLTADVPPGSAIR